MKTANRNVTQNDVHNFHLATVRGWIDKEFDRAVIALIAEAHRRHHEVGTSAVEEAKKINEAMGGD
jgi:hypothetical protein